MNKFYKWFGGKKMFVFFLLLFINILALCYGKFSDQFANFCLMLGGVYAVGNVGEHFANGGKDVRNDG